jgi:hypothetical protein
MISEYRTENRQSLIVLRRCASFKSPRVGRNSHIDIEVNMKTRWIYEAIEECWCEIKPYYPGETPDWKEWIETTYTVYFDADGNISNKVSAMWAVSRTTSSDMSHGFESPIKYSICHLVDAEQKIISRVADEDANIDAVNFELFLHRHWNEILPWSGEGSRIAHAVFVESKSTQKSEHWHDQWHGLPNEILY